MIGRCKFVLGKWRTLSFFIGMLQRNCWASLVRTVARMFPLLSVHSDRKYCRAELNVDEFMEVKLIWERCILGTK